MKITNKRQMYQMMAVGAFGNVMPTWLTLDAALASDAPFLGVRSLTVNDPVRLYWIRREDLREKMESAGILGRQDLIFSSTDYGMEADRIIQGEVTRGPWGLYFRHSFAPAPMRVAFEQDNRHATGLEAEMLLRRHVDPHGVDWLMELLHEYENPVVEFTTYRNPVGTLHQQTLIWEVRHY